MNKIIILIQAQRLFCRMDHIEQAVVRLYLGNLKVQGQSAVHLPSFSPGL